MNTFWGTCLINHNNHKCFVALENQSHQSQSFEIQSHQSRSHHKKKKYFFFQSQRKFWTCTLVWIKTFKTKFWQCWFFKGCQINFLNGFTNKTNENAKLYCSNCSLQNLYLPNSFHRNFTQVSWTGPLDLVVVSSERVS